MDQRSFDLRAREKGITKIYAHYLLTAIFYFVINSSFRTRNY
jgi:hypothetical protein